MEELCITATHHGCIDVSHTTEDSYIMSRTEVVMSQSSETSLVCTVAAQVIKLIGGGGAHLLA